jgi:general secretion pathway protein A
MYCSFYGFSEKPFNVTPDPRFLYLSPSHREVLASLTYGIHERRGFISVVGEVGTGKTTLINTLLDRLNETVKVAFIFNTDLGFTEILLMALADLGLCKPEENLTKLEALHRLNDFAIKQMAQGGNVVLIVDEAQNLDAQSMENLRLLSNLETKKHKLIQIILSGQPELDEKLARPELRQLSQRISLKRYIQPLTEEETYAYIDHRLSISESHDPQLFDRTSKKMIWTYSLGVPRKINILCDNIFLIGFGLRKKRIRAPIVEEAISDLTPRPIVAPEATEAMIPETAVTDAGLLPPAEKRSTRRGWVFALALILAAFGGSAIGILSGYSLQSLNKGNPIPLVIYKPITNPAEETAPSPEETVPSPEETASSPALVIPDLDVKKDPGGYENRETAIEESRVNKVWSAIPVSNRRLLPGEVREESHSNPPSFSQGVVVETETLLSGLESAVVVRPGDTLSKIMEKTYGRYHKSMLREVLRRNPQIRNPEVILAGQVIEMPPVSAFE